MNVRFPRFVAALLIFPVVFVAACNRGAPPQQPGKAAPDFTVSDGASTVHLADYRGKVVLLNFWATWCEPCVIEIPSLLQLHHDMPSLAIVAVSIDEDPDAYKTFLANRHIDFTTVRNPSQSVPTLFHTDMWPETYVIDRKGVIRRKFVGAQDWSSPEIRQYLNSL
jgi:cytochrome c biogenesis protein CcmG/thiol:disulfide interchange protein DsbE